MGKSVDRDFAKDLHRFNREIELEQKEEFGDRLPRAKSWGGRPSNKQERRRFKQNAFRLIDDPDAME
jgi:hypothetical protein